MEALGHPFGQEITLEHEIICKKKKKKNFFPLRAWTTWGAAL